MTRILTKVHAANSHDHYSNYENSTRYIHGKSWDALQCFAIISFESGNSGNMGYNVSWIGKINDYGLESQGISSTDCCTLVLRYNTQTPNDSCFGLINNVTNEIDYYGTFALWIPSQEEENKLAFFQFHTMNNTTNDNEDWQCSAQGFMIQYCDDKGEFK